MIIEVILNDFDVYELRKRFEAIGKRAYNETEIALLLYNSGAVRSFIRSVSRKIKESDCDV